jgi:nucleoid-associated protein YgaU
MMVVLLVGIASMLVIGCGPKKEEVPQLEPAEAPAAAPPAAPARAPVVAEPAPPPAPLAKPKRTPAHGLDAPAADAPVAEAAAGGQTYTVQKGDGLMAIARKVYGDQKLYKQIYEANKDKIGPPPGYALKVGTVLTIPPK